MYALRKTLEALTLDPLAPDQLVGPTLAARLATLAQRERRTLTLYFDRAGRCVHRALDDEGVPTRHLRHRGTNRLSGIRALRALPPGVDLPRGRDRREVEAACLDALLLVQEDQDPVLLSPAFDGEGWRAEEVATTWRQLPDLGLEDHLDGLRAGLGRHRKLDPVGTARPRTLLVGVQLDRPAAGFRAGAALDELARLVRTAGLDPAGRVLQRRAAPHPRTLIGAGKLAEIRARILDEGFEGVAVAVPLTYPVARRLRDELGVPVIGRTELILEIFARHARGEEGRLQVDLARMQHQLHRLLAEEKDLDRTRGGIGVLGGAGETGAALLRRRIHRKRQVLRDRLARRHGQRRARRERRARGALARVSLAGYTNAGKSTLLNALVGAEVVEAADRLFATLDTTTRRVRLPSGRVCLASDTVGFVQDLPHQLVDAFRATLAEATDTDLTLVVAEADPETLGRDLEVVGEALRDLGGDPSRRRLVLSKVDRASPEVRARLAASYPEALQVSALTGEGMAALRAAIEEGLSAGRVETRLRLPFSELGRFDALVREGQVAAHRFTDEGVEVQARLEPEQRRDLAAFVVSEVP